MSTIAEYIKILAAFDEAGRYFFFRNKGQEYKESTAPKTQDQFVKGFYSDLWIYANETPVGWHFSVQCQSWNNRGIAAMVCEILDGMTTNELDQVVWQDFAELGKLFRKEDKKLIQAILNKCKQLSKDKK